MTDPDMPDMPDGPDKPEMPDGPGTPDGPDSPDTPDTPGSPGKPRPKYEPVFKDAIRRERRGPRRGWRERQAEQQRVAAERAEGRSHIAAVLRRTFFGRSLAAVVLALMIVAGIGTTLYILSQQRTFLPEWLPAFGEERFELAVELSSAQSVTPGQGQPVLINGVEIGLIDSVRLDGGHAVVDLHVVPEYAPVIRSDASVLLRPRTNLNDMAIQVYPGESRQPIAEGTTIPLERSQPNVNPDQFFARLDVDTRDYIKLLVSDGAEGLRGGARDLSQGLRRLEPFARHIARLNGEVAKRRQALARTITNFRLLTEELARNDVQIRRFVSASGDALGGFASREAELRAMLREFPPTLRATRSALEVSRRFSDEMGPALTELLPQAEALGPGLEATGRFFRQTTDPIAEQIRPFTRQTRPTMRRLAEAADPFADSVREFGRAIGALNDGFNMLAFDPAGRPGYLFYLPWLNHNLNATYTFQGANGPARRGMVMLTCNLVAGFVDGLRRDSEYLQTVGQATSTPTARDIANVTDCE